MKKKALVIRFSSIGDIILTTPVIRCLSNQGGYEVHLLTHKKYAHVLKDNPHLTVIHPYESGIWEISQMVKSEKYDVIIDLHKSIRSYLLRIFLFSKVYGFKKLRIKRWLRTIVKNKLSPDRHIALRFLDAVGPIGLNNDNEGLDFFIQKKEIYSLPKEYSKKRIALIPGANFYTKTIPVDKLIGIISQWPDLEFHILGGEKEKGKYDELSNYPNVSIHCGLLSLGQSASIIDQCDAVVTADTAMMHIAAALRKKIISVWGGTVREFGFYPFLLKGESSYVVIENNDLPCRPCSKSGKHNCPKDHFNCMNTISTNDINYEIKNLL